MIYLDYAAATPLDAAVLAAMQPYLTEQFYNPSASYLAAKKVAAELGSARSHIAACLGVKPGQIVFTAGGTEANNLAISGVMKAYPYSNMVISAIEHPSVLVPASQYKHKLAKVTPEGIVDVDKLAKLIDDQTVLLSIMLANNEIGTVQPMRRVAKLVAEVREERKRRGNNLPLFLHSDACQATNYLDLHVSRLGVDMLTINSGKIYGPKQCGLLAISAGVNLQPIILGGGQEFGMRSGSENVANIIGFASALEKTVEKRSAEHRRLAELQQLFVKLLEKDVPTATVNGSLDKRLPNNLNVSFEGVDNETLMMQLDEVGVLVATGSACSASNDEPSHVLKALGLNDTTIKSSIRFSMGRDTTESDIRETVARLAKYAGKKRP